MIAAEGQGAMGRGRRTAVVEEGGDDEGRVVGVVDKVLLEPLEAPGGRKWKAFNLLAAA